MKEEKGEEGRGGVKEREGKGRGGKRRRKRGRREGKGKERGKRRKRRKKIKRKRMKSGGEREGGEKEMKWFTKHMLQSLFVKLSYLFETEQCMSGGDALPLGRRKGIEHAVVGVNRGKTVP